MFSLEITKTINDMQAVAAKGAPVGDGADEGGTGPSPDENVRGNSYSIDDVPGDKAAMRANTFHDLITLAADFAED